MKNVEDIKQFTVAEIQISYKSKVKPSIASRLPDQRMLSNCCHKLGTRPGSNLSNNSRCCSLIVLIKCSASLKFSPAVSVVRVADPTLIFVAALKVGPSGIILSHY